MAKPKNIIKDNIDTSTYNESIPEQQEWSNVAGLGTPANDSDVTGQHLFRQTGPPERAKEGDEWVDTDDMNKRYKLVNGVWVLIDNTTLTSPSIYGWSTDISFSSSDYNTIAWSAGDISLSDGTTYNIDAGDTGNISDITYIFLDDSVSTTVLQTTTVASNAVGTNRILIAVGNDNADTAKNSTFQVFGNNDQSVFITADAIAANTITANEIAANTITAGEIATGTITIGNLVTALQTEITSLLPGDENLIGYWSLDEPDGDFIEDSSQGENKGTIYGSPTRAVGVSGNALVFNGVSQYVDLGASILTGTMSVSMWVYIDDMTRTEFFMIGTDTDSKNWWYLAKDLNNISYGWRYDDAGVDKRESFAHSGIVSASGWYHFVAVVDSVGGTHKFYVNGVEVDSATSTYTIGTVESPTYLSQNHATQALDGKMDEVRIYDKVLTQNEVYALYKIPSGNKAIVQIPTFPSDENLLNYWSFDEGSGDLLTDYGVNGDSGDIQGSPTWDSGISGTCLDLVPASNQYVDLTASYTELDGATAFSVSVWVWPDVLPFTDFRGIFSCGKSGQRTPWIYGNSGFDSVKFSFETTTAANDGNVNTDNLTAGAWNHLVFTWDGTNVKTYLNGVQGAATDTTTGNTLANNDGQNQIGKIGTFDEWDGKIDEVRVYDKALTQEEIQALYRYPSGVTSQGVKQLGGIYSTDSGATSGLKMNPSGIQGYDASGNKTFDLETATGNITAQKFTGAGGVDIQGTIKPVEVLEAGENISAGDAYCILGQEFYQVECADSTYIAEAAPTTNYGGTAQLYLRNSAGNDQEALLTFDLSSVPAGAEKAYIRIYDSGGAATDECQFHRVTSSWTEGAVTWNTAPTVDATPVAIEIVPQQGYYNYIDITTLYNQWKAGTYTNYGINIKTNYTSTNFYLASDDDGTAAYRPQLIVYGASSNAGKAYKADSSDYSKAVNFRGFALETVTSGNDFQGQVVGIVDGLSSLEEGYNYFLQDTAGTIDFTPGTFQKNIGIATSATELAIQSEVLSASGAETDWVNFSEDTTFPVTTGFRPRAIFFEFAIDTTTTANDDPKELVILNAASSANTAWWEGGNYVGARQEMISVPYDMTTSTSYLIRYDANSASSRCEWTVETMDAGFVLRCNYDTPSASAINLIKFNWIAFK